MGCFVRALAFLQSCLNIILFKWSFWTGFRRRKTVCACSTCQNISCFSYNNAPDFLLTDSRPSKLIVHSIFINLFHTIKVLSSDQLTIYFTSSFKPLRKEENNSFSVRFWVFQYQSGLYFELAYILPCGSNMMLFS